MVSCYVQNYTGYPLYFKIEHKSLTSKTKTQIENQVGVDLKASCLTSSGTKINGSLSISNTDKKVWEQAGKILSKHFSFSTLEHKGTIDVSVAGTDQSVHVVYLIPGGELREVSKTAGTTLRINSNYNVVEGSARYIIATYNFDGSKLIKARTNDYKQAEETYKSTYDFTTVVYDCFSKEFKKEYKAFMAMFFSGDPLAELKKWVILQAEK